MLPFEVSGSGAEEWRDGMATMLSTGLDGAGGLRAISDRTVFARWEEALGPGESATQDEALGVAGKIGARYAVVGSAGAVADDLRLSAGVYETASGNRLGQVQVRGSPENVTSLIDKLTREVLGILLEKSEEGIPSVDLASVTTESLEALKSFLEGERHFRAGEYDAAVENFKMATRQDSAFALAYARLAIAQWAAGSPTAQVGQNWHRAHERASKLPSRYRRLVRAGDLWLNKGKDLAAADSLRQLTTSYPDDPDIWYSLGEVIMHSSIPNGFPEADRAFKHAVELDPGHAPYYSHLVQMAFMFHRDSALATQRIAAQPETRGKTLFKFA